VTTLAGAAGQTGSTDGTGSAARFNNPEGLAVDGGGNLYVADVGNETIRKITPGGVVSTLAGAAGQYGSSDGTGSAARFYNPSYVAVDGSGNVFVSDLGNYIIRKITPGGVVTTLAGTAGQTGSSDGSGSAARFGSGGFLGGVAVDGSDNVYVADSSTIRQIAPGGVVTTLAGTAGQYGSTDGTGSAARFRFPGGIAVDVSNRVYVADSYNDTIRKGTPPLDLFSGSVVGANLKLSPWFGYYAYGVYPLVYEYNLGYEYTFDAGSGGVYLYDYTSGHFWYTQSTYFPFVYDFSLNCFLYYYQANTPHRHFYSYGTNAVITE
jgi:hypothetical protein